MTNTGLLDLFPETYQASRERFCKNLGKIQAHWPQARLEQHPIPGKGDLSIDVIASPANQTNRRVLLFTTGEHGIEGYTGSAMLQLFLDSYLERLDPADTGLMLVHAINPWGMHNWRRTNAENVDLNRNFLYNPAGISVDFNPQRRRLEGFLSPKAEIRNYTFSKMACWLQIAYWFMRLGERELRETILLGQYRQTNGIFYGGDARQHETDIMVELYRRAFESYDKVLHLDMHTGYGPRYQMSMVNSGLDKRSSMHFSSMFNYPLVVAATGDEFYPIQGDMIDFMYTLREHDYPGKGLYATSFEFGTYGETTGARALTFIAMILENQLNYYGAANPHVRTRVERDFYELFYPIETNWRSKALADAQQAFDGILKAFEDGRLFGSK